MRPAHQHVGQLIKFKHEADCRFRPAKTRSQPVVTPAASDPCSGAADIDFESKTRVVVEPRDIAKVDLETILQLKRLDHRPQTLKTTERSLRAGVSYQLASVNQDIALPRNLNELREGPRVCRVRVPDEEALKVSSIAPIDKVAHLVSRLRTDFQVFGDAILDFDVVKSDQ